jgi:hypothetical protein
MYSLDMVSIYANPGRQLSQLPVQPYIQSAQGVEAVEAFDGEENLAFGRMQGGGIMQLSAPTDGRTGSLCCATDKEKVREAYVY